MVDYGYLWDQLSEVFKIGVSTCQKYYCNATEGPDYGKDTFWEEADDKFLDDERAKGVAFDVIAVGIERHTPVQCASRYQRYGLCLGNPKVSYLPPPQKTTRTT